MFYVVLYQWYETTCLGIVKAKSEKLAKIRFCIEELKHAKKECLCSDMFFDMDEPLRPQIRDLVDGYGTGSLTCLSCDKEKFIFE